MPAPTSARVMTMEALVTPGVSRLTSRWPLGKLTPTNKAVNCQVAVGTVDESSGARAHHSKWIGGTSE